MKKNISINISGIIFHIEEDGYDTLRKYLDSVNRYFASFDDSSEILADIESRIAEIFLSKLNEGKQVITAEDVSTLIATMGSVSDFKAAEEKEFADEGSGASESKSRQQQSASSATTPHQRLYRDKNKKILGGVCSGLGHYFNIDPVWPRLLFVLLLLAYGATLIPYILLWIFLPVAELEEEPTVKKMYRDPDKKVVGGVASGIAAFFSTDVTFIRVFFVVSSIFFASGLVMYIILWMVLPEAKTITEKMKMQGEPVTLSNIESTVKKGLHETGSEESVLSRIILFPFRILAAIINGLSTILGPALRMIIDVIRVAIGLVFTLTGAISLIALILSLGVLLGILHAPGWSVFSEWSAPNIPLEAFRNSFPTWTVVFSFLVVVIPMLFLVLLGSSIMARRLVFSQTVGWSMFGLFFISVAVVALTIPQIIHGFKEEGEFKVEQSFVLNGKTPVLKINETGLDDYEFTSLDLKGYDGKEIKLVERFQAQGSSRKLAAENAQMVDYTVVQTDSIITFDSNIAFKKDAKFKAQRLDIDVMIPFNQPFVIEASLWRLIDTDVISYGHNFRNLNLETKTWLMTDHGLQCLSCPQEDKSVFIGAKDQFGLKDFNGISLTGAFKTRIEKGDDFAVEITGSESERKRYDVYANGGTLVIEYNDSRKNFWKKPYISREDIQIKITMPSLRELEVTGAGKLTFIGFEEDELEIKLMGAVVADGEVDVKRLNVNLTGASMLNLKGKGKFMDADIVGASGLKAYGYEVEHCIVEAHGASSAKVTVTGTLEMTEGIASNISHHGNPDIVKR